ncbi:MAG: GNAT family N-acetyltransferase [Chlamydiae bacterium]|nr:GNAT family N-acetyltransferase [Chlamydiota bacterium]
MELEIVIGHNFQKHIDTVANLRISIFREYPYLYDGNISYEADYLKSYVLSKNSILILARDKGQIVGALTGLPLLEADEMFRIVFEKNPFPIDSIFYLGEILLIKEYRGKGIGFKMYTMFEELVMQNNQLTLRNFLKISF